MGKSGGDLNSGLAVLHPKLATEADKLTPIGGCDDRDYWNLSVLFLA